ncbi:MAG: outer membrane beta-barrel protein, partial [Flavobacteriales bacterium]|nr:outer membrane beta-barrel protein [Flavobacteriales bacterium]
VYKTPSADLPGEFGGAVVKIYTRNPSDRNEVHFGYSTSFREGTTMKTFVTNKLSKWEVLGFDNGVRDVPEGIPSRIWDTMNVTLRAGYTRKFSNNWQLHRMQAIPDQRFNLSIFNAFGKKIRVGHTTAVNYSNTFLGVAATRDDFNELPPDTLLGKVRPDTLFSYLDYRYENNVRLGLVHNWSLSTKHHRVEIKNLFNQLGLNQVVLRDGKEIVESYQYRREYSFRYIQRSIYNLQINAQHDIGAHGKLDYALGHSMARRDEPDWRRIRYTKPLDDPEAPFTAIVSNDANPFFLGRLYFKLREKSYTANVNYEHRFPLGRSGKWITFKTGAFYEYKRRFFNARNIGYKPANIFMFDFNIARQPVDSIFQESNLNSQNGLVISESTNRSDSYRATNRLHAAYLMADLPFWRFRLNAGVRLEYNIQELDSTYSFTTSQDVKVYNPILSVLPSATLIYNLAEKHSLKGAFGITVNRPEFRELAPFSFYDFNLNIVIYGNEALKTPQIFNYDLKYEFSPSPSEVVSLGSFYKKFVNPIESYFIPGAGSGGTRNFSYQNAESAFSTGAELEFRKMLDFGIKGLRDFTLVGNVAYIYSRIELGEKAKGQNNNRPLMGQSPYVVNTGIFYQNEKAGIQFNILYNVIGPRIVIVGSQGIPDIYEMPRNIIDITASKIFNLSGPQRKINHQLEFRLGVQDILNQPILMVQDINGNNRVERHNDWNFSAFRRGRYFTVGVNYRIR